jgi:signal transduction histidine kinase
MIDATRSLRIRAGLLGAGLALAAGAHAAGALEAWRDEVSRARVLAENDAPLAHELALRLQSGLPGDAAPADQARVLNLLARSEVYLGQTDDAARHAQAALQIATRNDDRIGEAEAELNVALNSVNQGRMDGLLASTTHSLAVLDGVKRPDLLGEALLRTAMTYRRFGQIEESVAMCVQAMDIARHDNDPLALTYAHQCLAISYDQSGRGVEMREHYEQMAERSRVAHSKLLEAYALTGLGRAVTGLGDAQRGEALIRDSIALYRSVGAPFGVTFGLFGLADHMSKRGRHAEALRLLDEVLRIYEQHPNAIGQWYALNARSADNLALGHAAAARADVELAYALAKGIGFPLYMSESAQRMAAIAAARGEHRRAYELSLEASEMAARATRERASARMVELAQRYESQSRQRQLDELMRRTERQAAELQQRALQQRWLWTVLGGSAAALLVVAGFFMRLRRAHGALGIASERLQRSQNDLQSQTAILQSILDSMGDGVSVANERGDLLLLNPAGERIVGVGISEGGPADRPSRYGLYLPDQSTPYPATQLPLARAVRGESCDDVEMFVRNAALPEGRWLSVTARPLRDKGGVSRGGVAVFSDVTARKLAEWQLQTSRDLLRRLAARQEAAREEERKRIAREIHDELGQLLTVLRIGISTLRISVGQGSTQLLPQIQGLMETTDRTLRVARDVVTQLRPPVLDAGLISALEWLAAEFARRTGVECRLHCSEEKLAVEDDRATMIFRTVQESLTNIARHARASRADITLRRDGDQALSIEVRDDGCGFDTSALAPRSFGLAGMRERARMFGGELSIVSAAGRGTAVQLRVATHSAQEEAA